MCVSPDDLLKIVGHGWNIQAEECTTDGWLCKRVRGGFNNALYQVTKDELVYAVKLCVPDERRRASREYEAMRLLDGAGLDIAPQPIALVDNSPWVPYPAVIYKWVAGEMPNPGLDPAKLVALLDSYQQMHVCRPENFPQAGILPAIFHWMDFDLYFSELHKFLGDYGPWLQQNEALDSDCYERLAALVSRAQGRVVNSNVDPSAAAIQQVFCRVDPNLANSIWGTDHKIRWVDWEYSGWGDPALDLAELRWHAALDGLSDQQRSWIRENYLSPQGDRSFWKRVQAWDCILAVRWPLIILRWVWSEYNGPDRLRLTRPAVTTQELWQLLEIRIGRAEALLLN